jgi:hypothetical protein
VGADEDRLHLEALLRVVMVAPLLTILDQLGIIRLKYILFF